MSFLDDSIFTALFKSIKIRFISKKQNIPTLI